MSRHLSRGRNPFRRHLLALAAAASLSSLAVAQVETSGPLFTGIGTLGGSWSNLNSSNFAKPMSDDGTVLIGYSADVDSHSHAFRWTLEDGMQDLGTLGGNYSYARALSRDGSTVVGQSNLAGDNASRAFRWTSSGGMQNLGTLGGTYSYANGVSADGAVVVGYSHLTGDNAAHAFRWQSGSMQDLGSLGSVTLTADMTWQLKDNSRLLPTSPLESDNGEAGSPKWVGDFRLTWAPSKTFSVFYGMNVIGATSDQQDFEDRNGGPCLRSFNNNGTPGNPADDVPIYGVYCPDLTAPAVFYHNISATKEIADGRFVITAGINNLFDTRPPQVSFLNGQQISMLGPVVAASQYGFAGRRVFVNVSAKF